MNSKYDVFDKVYFFDEKNNQILQGEIKAIHKTVDSELYEIQVEPKNRQYVGQHWETNILANFISEDLNSLKLKIKNIYKNKFKNLKVI